MRVVVTGTEAADGAARRPRSPRRGSTSRTARSSRVEPIAGPPVVAGGYDWVVLTSRIAVERALRRLDGRAAAGSPSSGRARPRRCASAASSRRSSPGVSTQEGLAAELPRPAGTVLFAGAEGARDVLVAGARRRRRPALPDRRAPAASASPTPTSSSSPPPRRPGASPRSASTCRASRSGRSPRRRRARSGCASSPRPRRHDLDGLVEAVKLAASRPVHHLPDRLRPRGRLRRHLPRRDQAHRARRAGDRHHARDRADSTCSRARSSSPARCRTCRRAFTSPSSTPGSAATASALALRGADGRLYVGPDNGLLLVAAERLGGVEEAVRARPGPATGSSRSRARSTAATSSRPRRRTWRVGVPLAELGPPVRPTQLVRAGAPGSRGRARPDPRDRPLRRPVRERPAQPHSRRPRAGGHRAGRPGRGRRRLRALLRRGREDVRGGQDRRHRPLRGRVREHRPRHQPGKRGRDVRAVVGQELRLTTPEA